MQTKLAHAREIAFLERRAGHDVGQELQAAFSARLSVVKLSERGVGSDIGVELRADAGERFVHVDRRSAAAAFVQHVGRHRGQPVLARWIARRPRGARAA